MPASLNRIFGESAISSAVPVDAADFRTHRLPLLFFNRSSDVNDEEYTTALLGANEGTTIRMSMKNRTERSVAQPGSTAPAEAPRLADSTLAAFIWKNAEDLWGDFRMRTGEAEFRCG